MPNLLMLGHVPPLSDLPASPCPRPPGFCCSAWALLTRCHVAPRDDTPAPGAPRPTVGLVVVHADPLQLQGTVPNVAAHWVDPMLLANHLPELQAKGWESVGRDPKKAG